jgi:hypothetical protein
VQFRQPGKQARHRPLLTYRPGGQLVQLLGLEGVQDMHEELQARHWEVELRTKPAGQTVQLDLAEQLVVGWHWLENVGLKTYPAEQLRQNNALVAEQLRQG